MHARDLLVDIHAHIPPLPALDGLSRDDADRRIAALDPPIEHALLAGYTVRDAIEHMAAHNSHHLGQVVLLRQMLGAWPPPSGSYTW